jgi:hypothetical protein
VSSFDTCAYGWKLSYIDKVDRVQNFFSGYGLLVHDCFERFFKKELGVWDLSEYYRTNYSKFVVIDPPPFPAGMGENYKMQGQKFFDNFDFYIDNYNVLSVEDKIDFDFRGSMFVAKPDLVLYNKQTTTYSLVDYKTSAPLKVSKTTGKETWDKKKMESYYKQMYIYGYALRNYRFIPIEEITIWFPRLNKIVTVPYDMKKEAETMDWLEEGIARIRMEENFLYDNTQNYFCFQLCSVRNACEYK